MFLKNYWYIAALRRDIGTEPVARTLLGNPIVFFRKQDGTPVALEDRCVHRNVPLSRGRLVDGDKLQCPYHGLTYDEYGACVRVPGQTNIPPRAQVQRYPVVDRYEWLWVWIGDPRLADPATIPDFAWFDRPGWRTRVSQLHLQCGQLLVIDNLLNMAHLPFVHPRTIGTDDVADSAEVKTERAGDTVRVSRWMYDVPPPPTYKTVGGFDGNVDRWQIIDFVAPGFFQFDTGVAEVGDGARHGGNRRTLHRHAMHGVVPETTKTSHYYFGFAYDPEDMSEESADFLFEQVFQTFREDVDILEAQQRNMELMPGAPTIDTNSDAGGLQALRIMERLHREQQARA